MIQTAYIVPLRGNNRRCPNKHFRMVNGAILFDHTFNWLMNEGVESCDIVVVSDHPMLLQYTHAKGCLTVSESERNDEESSVLATLEGLQAWEKRQKYNATFVALLNADIVIGPEGYVDRIHEHLVHRPMFQGALSCFKPQKNLSCFVNKTTSQPYIGAGKAQDFDDVRQLSWRLNLFRREPFVEYAELDSGIYQGLSLSLCEHQATPYFDIDTEWDFELYESYCLRRKWNGFGG